MRLEQLSLTAIGPYADTQVVDFARLGDAGLFLFEGPTGAGKSTVLDAITFALYGTTAAGDAGRMASHFRSEEVQPRVELVFRANGQRYQVIRCPAYQRPSKRGSGMVEEKPSVLLNTWDGSAWSIVSTNISEVAQIIGDALGLTRQQFTQVVLLPQGEFDRFLDAGPDERQKVLTRLFNAERYDRITDWFERAAKRARDVIAGLKNEITAELTAAAEAGEATGDELANWVEQDDPRSALRTFAEELEVHRQSADLAVLGKQSAVAAAERTSLDTAARLAVIDRLQALLDRRNAHQTQSAEVELARTEYERATKARHLQPLVAHVDQAQATAAEACLELAAAQHGCPDLNGLAPDDAARQWRAEAAGLQHLIDLERSLPQLEKTARAARDDAQRLAEELAAARAAMADLPVRRSSLSEHLAKVSAEVDALAAVQTELAQAEDRLAHAQRATELAPQLVAARASWTAAIEQHQRAVDAHQALVERRIAGMAAQLAADLIPGEPCGVCGSTEHPHPAESADSVTAAQVEAARVTRANADEDRQAKSLRVSELEAAVSAAHAASAGLSLEAAQAERDRLALSAARRDALRIEQRGLTAELDRLAAEQGSLAEQTDALIHSTATAQGEADRLASEVERAHAQLGDEARGFASVAGRAEALQTTATLAAAVAEAQRVAAAAQAAAHDALARAEVACSDAGLSLSAAREALRASERMKVLADQIRAHDAEGSAIDLALQSEEFQAVEVADRPTVAAEAAAATEQLQLARDELQKAATVAESLRDRGTRFAYRMEQVARLVAAKDKAQAESKAVLNLAEFCRGMNSGQRITLTAFYLRFWFEHVIDAANLRLSKLATGRYTLRRTDEGSRSSDRVGLGLTVFDAHTGKERSAGTMSGGERFLTSLALALGLADVVQAEAGGAKLDTLFVDEGFGTLDDERLEEILAVLDGLKENGRVVGIVSHVAELKDRIQERIEVRRKSPDGPSELKVVA